MSMSKREGETQSDLWIPTTELAQSPGHPFYERLNKILAGAGFDAFVEKLCAPFYAKKNGRPSIAPGIYVRILMVGYFVGPALGARDRLALRGLALLARLPRLRPLEEHARPLDPVPYPPAPRPRDTP